MQMTCAFAATAPPNRRRALVTMTALTGLVIWVQYGFRILLNTGRRQPLPVDWIRHTSETLVLFLDRGLIPRPLLAAGSA